jgi:hypothetical protein
MSSSDSLKLLLGIATALIVGAVEAQGAGGSTGIDTSGNYQSELQACKEGRTAEDQPTCLREARNAQDAKKRGALDNGNGQFEANAMARCDVLKGDDKAACEARMMGHGQVSGSVAGGGLLREIETVIPADSQAAVQPPSSAGPPAKAPAQ